MHTLIGACVCSACAHVCVWFSLNFHLGMSGVLDTPFWFQNMIVGPTKMLTLQNISKSVEREFVIEKCFTVEFDFEKLFRLVRLITGIAFSSIFRLIFRLV